MQRPRNSEWRGINVNNVSPGPPVIRCSEGVRIYAPCPDIPVLQDYSDLLSL